MKYIFPLRGTIPIAGMQLPESENVQIFRGGGGGGKFVWTE